MSDYHTHFFHQILKCAPGICSKLLGQKRVVGAIEYCNRICCSGNMLIIVSKKKKQHSALASISGGGCSVCQRNKYLQMFQLASNTKAENFPYQYTCYQIWQSMRKIEESKILALSSLSVEKKCLHLIISICKREYGDGTGGDTSITWRFY